MRLIDADALIKRLNEIGAPYRADINNAIAEAPTADAVEVVRCKDCYWYDKGKNDCDSWEWCKRHKFDSYDEGFCSWATHKKQVTSKLKKPCDSLLTEDSEERKEQKSKLDLISRQDAIEAVRLESAKHLLLGRGDILDILEEIPTVDAVEAVRCKDCKYSIDYYNDGGRKERQMRLIDADALKQNMLITTAGTGYQSMVLAEVDEAPTIDTVEVVRCKDCRYFKKIVERSDSGLCHRDIVASAWKEDGYCSRGERKGGDTE